MAQGLNKPNAGLKSRWVCETALNQTSQIKYSNLYTRNWTESCEDANEITKSKSG